MIPERAKHEGFSIGDAIQDGFESLESWFLWKYTFYKCSSCQVNFFYVSSMNTKEEDILFFSLGCKEMVLSSVSCTYQNYFFGGQRECAALIAEDDENLKRCFKCQYCTFSGEKYCEVHGDEYVQWKCQYCCSVAGQYRLVVAENMIHMYFDFCYIFGTFYSWWTFF